MKNIVFDAAVYESANKINKDLLNDYLVELKSRKLKPSSLEQYGYDGRMLICYIKTDMNDMSILEFNKKDFRKVALWLTEERKVSNARFNRVFALIHKMMEYAEDEDDYEYEKNYARKIKNLPKDPVREIVFLTDQQITNIRNYLLAHGKYRECAYLDISYDSAARLGEVNQITKDEILDARYTNTVTGKRGKKFNLLYHNRSLQSLSLYLEQRGEDDTPELWVTLREKSHRKITDEALYDWAKDMSKILSKLEGKSYNFSPHSFRHSALENYKNGTHYMCKEMAQPRKFSIEELQVLAHHDSMDTTRGYLKPNDNNVIESMFKIKVE